MKNEYNDLVQDTLNYFQALDKTTPLFSTEEIAAALALSQKNSLSHAPSPSDDKGCASKPSLKNPSSLSQPSLEIPSPSSKAATEQSPSLTSASLTEVENKPAASKEENTPLKKPSPSPKHSLEKTPESSESSSKKNPSSSKNVIEIKPLEKFIPSKNRTSLLETLKKMFPRINWADGIPNDDLAKKRAHAWKDAYKISPCILISHFNNTKEAHFLDNIAKAISSQIIQARHYTLAELEREKLWDLIWEEGNKKLFIIDEETLHRSSHLLQHYKHIPVDDKHLLDTTPLLLLKKLSSYLGNGEKKKQLWSDLCQRLS